jgi:hypothetical protein
MKNMSQQPRRRKRRELTGRNKIAENVSEYAFEG